MYVHFFRLSYLDILLDDLISVFYEINSTLNLKIFN